MKRRASAQLVLDTSPARRLRTSQSTDALPPHVLRQRTPLLTTSMSNGSDVSTDSGYSELASPSQHVPRIDPAVFMRGYASPPTLVSSPTFPSIPPASPLITVPQSLLVSAQGSNESPVVISPTSISPSLLASTTVHVLQQIPTPAGSPTSGPLRMVPQGSDGIGSRSGSQSPIGLSPTSVPQIIDFSSAVNRLQSPAVSQTAQTNATLQDANPTLSSPTFTSIPESSQGVPHISTDNSVSGNHLSAPTQLSINTNLASNSPSTSQSPSLNSPPDLGTQISTLKKAGPYLLGPTLGTSPVRSIVQCLARKEGTDDFYCLKVRTH